MSKQLLTERKYRF